MIISAIADRDEYGLLTALNNIGEDRHRISRVFELTDKVVRDACIIRLGTSHPIGCDPEGAEVLSRTISNRRADAIHEAIIKTIARCGGTINVSPEMSALAASVII